MMARTEICAQCGQKNSSSVWAMRLRAGLPWECSGCRCDLLVTSNRTPKRRGRSDNQKRSIKQEKRVAEREGGRRQPASGALPEHKGDVRVPRRYRGECKTTKAKSYSVKLADLEKLEKQAYQDELPVFDLEFISEGRSKRYVFLPEWVFNLLMEESGRRDHGDSDNQ